MILRSQVSREIPPAELTATINRIIEANFLAMSPHVKWSVSLYLKFTDASPPLLFTVATLTALRAPQRSERGE
jgi:hypothetical protein